jgi:hypothetical protein
MTTFVIWPHAIDGDFRPAYAEIVQELVQEQPLDNGTHYMLGSSRITPEQCSTIQALFADVEFTETDPAWESDEI